MAIYNSRGAAGTQRRHAAPANGHPAVRPSVSSAASPAVANVRGKWKSRLKIFSTRSGMDLTFFFLVLLLVCIGLVMVFSASYANSSYRFGTPYFFVKNQAKYAVLGTVIMMMLSYFDYHHLHKLTFPVYLITVILLGITVVFKGSSLVKLTNGAYRWITIGGFQFQPSEIAKFALVLVFAHLLSTAPDKKDKKEQAHSDFDLCCHNRDSLWLGCGRKTYVGNNYSAAACGSDAVYWWFTGKVVCRRDYNCQFCLDIRSKPSLLSACFHAVYNLEKPVGSITFLQ